MAIILIIIMMSMIMITSLILIALVKKKKNLDNSRKSENRWDRKVYESTPLWLSICGINNTTVNIHFHGEMVFILFLCIMFLHKAKDPLYWIRITFVLDFSNILFLFILRICKLPFPYFFNRTFSFDLVYQECAK